MTIRKVIDKNWVKTKLNVSIKKLFMKLILLQNILTIITLKKILI